MSGGAWAGRRLHFIGVGGAGMSGLARVARMLGAKVTGSDRAESPYLAALRTAGVEAVVGHRSGGAPAGAEVVVSTAIGEDNPELAGARQQEATILHRGDLLAEVAQLKRCLAVAGTHGKTTTACMVAHAMWETGHRPAYLIGGELRSTGLNADWTDGEWLVVEADESDGSFLKLTPEAVVVTNVELDHHATYRSLPEVEAAFAAFASEAATRIVWHGAAVPGATVSFGIDEGDFAARDVELLPLGSRFTVDGARVELEVPGRHNVLNALAALAACRAAGIEPEEAAPALASFSGARRRFEAVGRTPSGARVFDDYAHHPTEVRATLEAARGLGARRLYACFQPHLYSRTRRLAREFGQALALADETVVLAVYPARERAGDFPGVSGLLVAAATADEAGGRPVHWLPAMESAEHMLRERLQDGDVLITLGAGDVDRLARSIVDGT